MMAVTTMTIRNKHDTNYTKNHDDDDDHYYYDDDGDEMVDTPQSYDQFSNWCIPNTTYGWFFLFLFLNIS